MSIAHSGPVRAHAMQFSGKDGVQFAMSDCKAGSNGKVLVDRSEARNGQSAKVRMVTCTNGPIDKVREIAAMKRARERMAADMGKDGGMSREIRASVVADLDKAIAELEAQ